MSGKKTEPEDISFSELMNDVTPISHDRADLQKKIRPENTEYRRAAAMTTNEQHDRGLSDQLKSLINPEEELIYASPGVQLREMRKLRKGHIPWEEGLDLHGYTVDRAREELGRFISQASRRNLRAVIVIHGKAHSEDGTPALLKSYTHDWLQQMHQVLAFVSAQPTDGGTGALYVLLRRRPRNDDGRQH